MPFQNDRHPWNVLTLLESKATPVTIADYGPRAAIFRQGDPCDSVMHIERGRVWLAVTARSGKEAICGLLDTGAFLGEEALTGCGERRQSATAMTATQVLVVAKAHMIRLLRTQSGLLDRFIAHLLARKSAPMRAACRPARDHRGNGQDHTLTREGAEVQRIAREADQRRGRALDASRHQLCRTGRSGATVQPLCREPVSRPPYGAGAR
jgi:CRP-like cAMP-binding protein